MVRRGCNDGQATQVRRPHRSMQPQTTPSTPPPFCRTTASLLGATSSARSKSRTSRTRPRLAPSSRRPRRPRRSRRPRTSCRRRGTALSTSAPSPTPSPSSASPLRADSRYARPGPRAPYALLCASCHSWLSLALVWPCRVAPTCTPLRSTLSSALITLSSNWRRVACVPAPRSPVPSTRVSRPRQARPSKFAGLRAAPFRRSGCRCS